MMEKHLVPQLRFPEFEDEWEFEKLKNVSKYFNGGSFESNVLEKGKYELITLKSINVEGGLESSQKFIDIEVPTLTKNTLIMILSEQAPGLLGMTTLIPKNNKYVLNQRVAEIRPNNKIDSFFLSLAINRNQRYFSRLGAGTKVQNITKPNVENYVFLRPKLPEQQKIASFLSDVDAKITQLTKKKELLEQYKKGIMQKIFNQELRFKDDNGNEFPKWEEKKLGDIFTFKQGFQFAVEAQSETYFKGSVEFIRIINVTSDKNDKRYVLDPGKEHHINKEDLFMVRYGDAGRVASGFTGIIANNMFRLLPHFEINKLFFFYSLGMLYKKIHSLSGSSTMPAISFSTINKLKIIVPSLTEQKKIANFLSDIDVKIEALNTKIEHSKTYKKGLLQQMFV